MLYNFSHTKWNQKKYIVVKNIYNPYRKKKPVNIFIVLVFQLNGTSNKKIHQKTICFPIYFFVHICLLDCGTLKEFEFY